MQASCPTASADALLARLRRETGPEHAELDRDIGPGVARSRESYARFLSSSFVAVTALEDAVQRALGADHPVERGALLRADLEALGVVVPQPGIMVGPLQEAAALGTAYVLEGSALGGIMLAKSVHESLGSDVSARYLTLHGAGTATRWRWFLEKLEAFGARSDEDAHASASRAAVRSFEVYAAAFAAGAKELTQAPVRR
jgi:heme oxygenase